MNNGWIDIHSHIIPSVDDGAKDWKMSNQMLQIAYNEGIRTIIATPHYHTRHRNPSGATLQLAIERLNQMAHKIDKTFNIYLGNELYYSDLAVKALDFGAVHTMADSNFVLVEFSPDKEYPYIKNALYHLQMEGYSPIIAHVERYASLHKELDRVLQLANMGIYIQVNAASVTGENGYPTKRLVKKLLKNELVHFIGTDAHNISKRPPEMKKCVQYLKRKFGEDYTHQLIYANALELLNSSSNG